MLVEERRQTKAFHLELIKTAEFISDSMNVSITRMEKEWRAKELPPLVLLLLLYLNCYSHASSLFPSFLFDSVPFQNDFPTPPLHFSFKSSSSPKTFLASPPPFSSSFVSNRAQSELISADDLGRISAALPVFLVFQLVVSALLPSSGGVVLGSFVINSLLLTLRIHDLSLHFSFFPPLQPSAATRLLK